MAENAARTFGTRKTRSAFVRNALNALKEEEDRNERRRKKAERLDGHERRSALANVQREDGRLAESRRVLERLAKSHPTADPNDYGL